MDELDVVKRRLKLKRQYNLNNDNNKDTNFRKYANGLITRVLLSVIILFIVLILSNRNDKIKGFIDKDVMTYNIPFNKVTNLYNKYFGNIIPIKNEGTESTTVFNEKLEYNDIKSYKDGYELSVKDNYLVPIISSGIVVFIGDKEDYGKTIIIQGNDLVNYWYGNITNESVKLYDYVNKGSFLGTAKGDKMYMLFESNGEYLGFEEVME